MKLGAGDCNCVISEERILPEGIYFVLLVELKNKRFSHHAHNTGTFQSELPLLFSCESFTLSPILERRFPRMLAFRFTSEK